MVKDDEATMWRVLEKDQCEVCDDFSFKEEQGSGFPAITSVVVILVLCIILFCIVLALLYLHNYFPFSLLLLHA